jgi:hypothetical protein
MLAKDFIRMLLSVTAICILFISLAQAELPLPGDQAAAQVTVTSVNVYPGEFFPYDTGTVSITVKNTGNSPVAIRRATIYDNNFIVEEGNYDSVGLLGAGNSMTFTFTLSAKAQSGIFYPVFSLDFRDSGFLRYPVKILVKETQLSVSIQDRPDSFTEGKKDKVGILIGNPRDNTVESVSVTPEGKNFDSIPSGVFIGTLDPNNATTATFTITPSADANITFRVSYKNGVNDHSLSVPLPLVMGTSKTSPNPVVSNIAVKEEGGFYRVTGDVTNAGLEDAKAVIITSSPPAVPVDPFKVNVVGSLKPDDFSSFEVTFKSENNPSIPLVIDYKDSDGNPYTNRMTVELPDVNTTGGKTGADSPLLPVAIVVAAAVLVGAIVLVSWRHRGSA